MTESFAEVAGLTLRHIGRRDPALRELSLRWEQGERLLLIGPSGAGKSTLALCLNGVIPHAVSAYWEAGSVTIEGRETRETGLAQLSTVVGVLFQDPETQLVMHQINDEIAFGLENHALDRLAMARRIAEARATTGLTGVDRPIAELSGGTKQRVALASLLALGTRGLVLDEPTANLDPAGTAELYEAIARLFRDRTRSLLLIEHRLDDAVALVDRVAVLDADGSLVLSGDPDDVFVAGQETLDRIGAWVPALRRLASLLDLPVLPRSAEEAAACLVRAWPHTVPDEPRPLVQPNLLLSGRGLRYQYPNTAAPAVADVWLDVHAGELVAIVGPNGAGKSTLGLLLARALGPDAGDVTAEGPVAYVFQYPEHQFVTRTVADELRASFRVRHLPAPHVEREVSMLLERLGLLRLANANPFALSHGEKRRLSVATALAADPAVLILDEPTFGQDERTSAALAAILDELRLAGRAIVVITHDLSFVADHATRAVALVDGAVAFDGCVRDLFAKDELLARCALRRPPVAEAFRIARLSRADIPALPGLAAARAALKR